MTAQKKTAAEKRARRLRDCNQSDDFIKDWERLERSGKHDMHRLKEAMLLLIANDTPLPPEWKDHRLNGKLAKYRECHIKGDLLLIYKFQDTSNGELVVFVRVGTHSEIFK